MSEIEYNIYKNAIDILLCHEDLILLEKSYYDSSEEIITKCKELIKTYNIKIDENTLNQGKNIINTLTDELEYCIENFNKEVI